MSDLSVLIVDDSGPDRYLLSRHLGETEFDVRIFEAQHGQEALDFLGDFERGVREFDEDFPPLIIFLDINMPVLNGFEFLEAFEKMRKENPACYLSCVVMMFSSSENPKDRDSLLAKESVSGYLVKGKTAREQLAEMIRDILKSSEPD